MNTVYLITGIVLFVYLVLVWILSNILHLQAMDAWVFRIGLALIGVGGAAIYLWWRKSNAPVEAGAPDMTGGANEVDDLIREAEARLANARHPMGSRIGNFPLVFVMGEKSAGKTSVIEHSGLEVELLAGQVYHDTAIVPTPSANLWFTRSSIFAEAGGKLAEEPALWTRLIRRSRAGQISSVVGQSSQAPRAAIICFDAENFTKSGATETAAAVARSLHAKLSEIAGILGINFPVYVLFTRMDRLPFFREYVRNLSAEEATQVMGATLPLSPAQPTGVYGQQQSARVSLAFDNLFRSLCDARPDLLARENNAETRPATYEFPREFRKIRGLVVSFLVDLCRPSQITSAAFLRGFYFCGVRPVMVNEMAPVSAAAAAKMHEPTGGATSVFLQGKSPLAPVEPRVMGSKRVPQWLFLSHLLNDVVLQDRVAMGTSASSTKTSFTRRLLLASAIVLCLILTAGFTISWSRNRGLESRAVEAARGISGTEANGQELASLDALTRLESLRQLAAELGGYESNGAPTSMRWGLYAGHDLYPEVRRVYFSRFRQLLFAQTQGSLHAVLERLPGTPAPGDEYDPAYQALKGYLITTSHHDKSTTAFLTPLLMKHWMAGRTANPQRMQLAKTQFDFYGGELIAANPFSSEQDSTAIERGRRYLSQFAGIEHVYRNMLEDASKNNPPIQFNKKFPGSEEALIDTHEVLGAFSKGGWTFMNDAIRHADRYFSGEQWVLGNQATGNVDRAKLESDVRDRYTNDFIAQWRALLNAAVVVIPPPTAPEISRKLNLIAGNQSPLLALFWLVSQNTAVDDPKISAAFQAVQAVVPPSSVDRYIAPPNQSYMTAMASLQTAFEQIAAQSGAPGDTSGGPVLSSATLAKSASRQVAQTFRPDSEAHIDQTVGKLMEAPITYVESFVRKLGPSELNAKGRALCAQLRPILSKYPFNPTATVQATLDEVNGMLRKPDGAIWTFYNANLSQLLPRQGAQYVAAPAGGISLNPAFVDYFNRAATVTDTLYAGGSQAPHIAYTLKPVPSEGIQDLTLRLDGHVLTTKGNSAAEQFVWPGTTVKEAKATVKFGGTDLGWSDNSGLWAVFQFFEEAERWQPAGAGYQLEWIVRAGKNAMTLPSGRPLTVRFDLTMGGAAPVFAKNYLSRLGCVANVAR